jgi:uncharacterized protein (DUF952 family)
MLVGVMLAEEKLGPGRQLGTDAGCCPAAIAPVSSSQLGSGQSCVHGCSVLACLQLCQTFWVFALFPGRYQVCRFSRIPAHASGKLATVPPTPAVLAHLCGEQEWAQARIGGGIPVEPSDSSDEAPFIHLSTLEQVHLPANRLFRGRTDLVLLYIDPAALDSPVRWEPGVPTDPESMLFPHLYGPLPATAVIKITPYRPGPDGAFPPVAESQDST